MVRVKSWQRVCQGPVASMLIVTGALCACSGDGSGDGAEQATTSAVTTTEPVTTSPVTTIEPVTTSPVTTIEQETSVPATVDQSDENEAGERVTVAGVTFVVPRSLAAGITSRLDIANTDEAAIRVVLSDRVADIASVRVITIRNQRDKLVPLASSDEAVVLALEDGTATGVETSFVNGSGVRDVGADYRFVGITTSGSQLVEVAALRDLDVGSMVALTESVFVDGRADVFAVSACQVDVETISAVAVDDGGVVSPGAVVTASWRTRNSGTCPWTERDGWVFAGGDPVTVVQIASVGETEPGAEVDVTVSFRAPTDPGIYSTQWQFLPAGELELVDTPIPVTFEVVAD